MNNILKFDKTTKTYIIVIKDNEASEYYASYVLPSWEQENIYPEIFNAVTPDTLNNYDQLKFGTSGAYKYKKWGILKEITQTERSCFYSHFLLWQECIKQNRPLLILEHDSLLVEPEALKDFNDKLFVTYDNSFGCYKIYPLYAKYLVRFCLNHVIRQGPYSTVEVVSSVLKRSNIMSDICVFHHSPEFSKAITQVMSKDLGNTISHYDDLDLKEILVTKFDNDKNRLERFKNSYEFRYIL